MITIRCDCCGEQQTAMTADLQARIDDGRGVEGLGDTLDGIDDVCDACRARYRAAVREIRAECNALFAAKLTSWIAANLRKPQQRPAIANGAISMVIVGNGIGCGGGGGSGSTTGQGGTGGMREQFPG